MDRESSEGGKGRFCWWMMSMLNVLLVGKAEAVNASQSLTSRADHACSVTALVSQRQLPTLQEAAIPKWEIGD